jgi:hypothetical protein
MPGGRPRAEDDLDRLDLSPARTLLVTMLRYAVSDAQSQATGRPQQQRRDTARAWLRDEPAVRYWLNLLGLPDTTYAAPLREAGIEEE